MSQVTYLASSQITAVDVLTIELVEANEPPPCHHPVAR